MIHDPMNRLIPELEAIYLSYRLAVIRGASEERAARLMRILARHALMQRRLDLFMRLAR